MRSLIVVLLVLISVEGWTQAKAELIKLEQLKGIMESKSDKIAVFNFWATWCAPCVKEIPLFEKLNQDRADVQVNLISMDMDLDPNPDKVHRFVTRKKLQSRVYILDETNPNNWIDKIEKDWSGALPATLIINSTTGERRFVEHELKEGELERLISEVK